MQEYKNKIQEDGFNSTIRDMLNHAQFHSNQSSAQKLDSSALRIKKLYSRSRLNYRNTYTQLYL